MFKLKATIKKSWVLIAATALIAGSSSAMAFALDNNVPEGASTNVASLTVPATGSNQIGATLGTVEYTVVDLSKRGPDRERKDLFTQKLSRIEGITPEQIEEKYNAMIANTIPGKKDISAEQAAGYAAEILKKAYEVNLTGYTAEASFSRNPVPNSDSWTVIFHAPQETETTKRYIVSVDSVKGSMQDAGFYTFDYTEDYNTDLENPEWVNDAVQRISKLLPENVSIIGNKVVLSSPAGGVIVVSELSDGSACAVRLTGENKDAVAYINFPNGYDGSLDYTPITANAVG